MVRSFDYAAWAGLRRRCEMLPGDCSAAQAVLTLATRAWSDWTARVYMAGYLGRLQELNPSLLPGDRADRVLVLRVWLLDKVMYEIRYELNARPDWVDIPLRAARALLQGDPAPVAPDRTPA
jgi:maltose alpha-D-glucosyltransferase/alpha-amylase